MRLLAWLLLWRGAGAGEECRGCTCTSPTSLTCCHLSPSSHPLRPPSCPGGCSVTHLTIASSLLSPTLLTTPWLEGLGVCPTSLTHLTLSNCSLGGVEVGGHLTSLTTLEVGGDLGAGLLPPPSAPGLTALHLAGGAWPCMVEDNVTTHSGGFGQKMAWLLEARWSRIWSDQGSTHCRALARGGDQDTWYNREREGQAVATVEEGGAPRTVASFLEFTERTSKACPTACRCSLARGQVKFQASQEPGARSLKVMVDCSGHNLRELPTRLPADTIFLDVSDNSITSLAALAQLNLAYQHLEGLDVSNNSLASLSGLETSWLMKKGARLLALQANMLTEVPPSP